MSVIHRSKTLVVAAGVAVCVEVALVSVTLLVSAILIAAAPSTRPYMGFLLAMAATHVGVVWCTLPWYKKWHRRSIGRSVDRILSRNRPSWITVVEEREAHQAALAAASNANAAAAAAAQQQAHHVAQLEARIEAQSRALVPQSRAAASSLNASRSGSISRIRVLSHSAGPRTTHHLPPPQQGPQQQRMSPPPQRPDGPLRRLTGAERRQALQHLQQQQQPVMHMSLEEQQQRRGDASGHRVRREPLYTPSVEQSWGGEAVPATAARRPVPHCAVVQYGGGPAAAPEGSFDQSYKSNHEPFTDSGPRAPQPLHNAWG